MSQWRSRVNVLRGGGRGVQPLINPIPNLCHCVTMTGIGFLHKLAVLHMHRTLAIKGDIRGQASQTLALWYHTKPSVKLAWRVSNCVYIPIVADKARTAVGSFRCSASIESSLPSTTLQKEAPRVHARSRSMVEGPKRVLEAGRLKDTSYRSYSVSCCSKRRIPKPKRRLPVKPRSILTTLSDSSRRSRQESGTSLDVVPKVLPTLRHQEHTRKTQDRAQESRCTSSSESPAFATTSLAGVFAQPIFYNSWPELCNQVYCRDCFLLVVASFCLCCARCRRRWLCDPRSYLFARKS